MIPTNECADLNHTYARNGYVRAQRVLFELDKYCSTKFIAFADADSVLHAPARLELFFDEVDGDCGTRPVLVGFHCYQATIWEATQRRGVIASPKK